MSKLKLLSKKNILILFGTRPEIIKLAPVIQELKARGIGTKVVSSSQHTHLLRPFLKMLDVTIDHDLKAGKANQGPNDVCSRVVAKLDVLFQAEKPDVVLVQGDTTTALAGAIAAFNRGIKVGHVEAGLRSGNHLSPFPEEMNRRLISQIADLHFAATKDNRDVLIKEGISRRQISVTGNPVVDSLMRISERLGQNQTSGKKDLNKSDKHISPLTVSGQIQKILDMTSGQRSILLTTHRRESFGETMSGNLRVLRDFIAKHDDTALLFPVHPNPNVRKVTEEILSGQERVFLLEPLDYKDFIAVMRSAWLIVSDSGGVQEEAPSLGKPLLVLRENTERPEAVRSGVARLVGSDPKRLKKMLTECYEDETWVRSVKKVKNPFGNGQAAKKIVDFLERNM